MGEFVWHTTSEIMVKRRNVKETLLFITTLDPNLLSGLHVHGWVLNWDKTGEERYKGPTDFILRYPVRIDPCGCVLVDALSKTESMLLPLSGRIELAPYGQINRCLKGHTTSIGVFDEIGWGE